MLCAQEIIALHWFAVYCARSTFAHQISSRLSKFDTIFVEPITMNLQESLKHERSDGMIMDDKLISLVH